MRRVIGRIRKIIGMTGLALVSFSTAQAQTAGATQEPMLGAPVPWGMGLQASGGPIKEAINDFNSLVFWLMVGVTIFVALQRQTEPGALAEQPQHAA